MKLCIARAMHESVCVGFCLSSTNNSGHDSRRILSEMSFCRSTGRRHDSSKSALYQLLKKSKCIFMASMRWTISWDSLKAKIKNLSLKVLSAQRQTYIACRSRVSNQNILQARLGWRTDWIRLDLSSFRLNFIYRTFCSDENILRTSKFEDFNQKYRTRKNFPWNCILRSLWVGNNRDFYYLVY